MRACRGMGAVNPKKLAKGGKIGSDKYRQFTPEELANANASADLADSLPYVQDNQRYSKPPSGGSTYSPAGGGSSAGAGRGNSNNLAKGGPTKNWIAGAIKKPGALRSKLGVKEGETISASKLSKAAESPGTLGREARLAQTLKGFHK